MTVELKPEDQALLEKKVADGDFASLEDALHAALDQFARADKDWAAYARSSIQAGLDDVAAGRVVDGDEVMNRLKARANRTAA